MNDSTDTIDLEDPIDAIDSGDDDRTDRAHDPAGADGDDEPDADHEYSYPIDVDRPHERVEDCTPAELLAVTAAREIGDGETAFIGVGMSLISGLLAKHTRAPNCQIVTESGYVGAKPPGVVQSISDTVLGVDALVATNQFQIFVDNQRGYFDVGIIGAGQIDKHGNTNSTVVLGDEGTYDHPKVRLPGSGGSNDIMTSCGRSVVMMRQKRRAFREEIDYVTAPGHLDGPGARDAHGFEGGGTDTVITDMAVFGVDDESKELVLERTHPGVTVADVRDEVQWDLQVADDVRTTDVPTRGEVAMLHAIDPIDVVLRGTDRVFEVEFDEWADSVMEHWRELQEDDE